MRHSVIMNNEWCTCSSIRREHIDTVILFVYLQTPRSSTIGMNHVFAFPAEAGTHLPTSEGWMAKCVIRRAHNTI